MKKRYIILTFAVTLAAFSVWLALTFAHPSDEPARSVSFKVPLRNARDRALLIENPDGGYHYIVTSLDGGKTTLTPDEFAKRLLEDQRSHTRAETILNVTSPIGFAWVALGLLGQLLFTGRMVVQWIVSEKHKASVVPPAFWWMSLVGSTMLLVYFMWRVDPIGLLGQAMGWFIYVRNLVLIYAKPGEEQAVTPGDDAAPEPGLSE